MTLASTVTTDLTISGEIEQTQTYKVSDDKIQGFTDGLAALQQTIDHMLNTEQYEFPIYSLDYGFQAEDLIGKDQEYVESELQRRIVDCLTQDDRINSVDNFQFSVDGDSMTCTFDVSSIYGAISSSKEVTI
jgi:Protein of unknown function (DUF2634).